MGIKSFSKGNRMLLISFMATFLILTVAAVAIIYLPSLQTNQHLPASYTVTAPDWTRFVAPGLDKVTMMNFTNIYAVNGDFSVFNSGELLVLSGISTRINVTNSRYIVTASYPNPNPNSDELALNILRPDSATYEALRGELQDGNLATYPYGGSVLYRVLRSTSDVPAYVNGYVCLRGGYVLYSDSDRGMDLVKGALDNEAGGKSIIDGPEVKASMYLLSQGKGAELAFSYSKFPYTVSGVVATSTTVRYDSGSILTSSVYAFNATSTAQRSLDKIKQSNLNASGFQIVDNYILATAKSAKATLLGELRSL